MAQEVKTVKEASKVVVENGDSGDSEQKSEAMEVDSEPAKTDDKKDETRPTVNGEGDGKEGIRSVLSAWAGFYSQC